MLGVFGEAAVVGVAVIRVESSSFAKNLVRRWTLSIVEAGRGEEVSETEIGRGEGVSEAEIGCRMTSAAAAVAFIVSSSPSILLGDGDRLTTLFWATLIMLATLTCASL